MTIDSRPVVDPAFDHDWEATQHHLEVIEFIRRDLASARHMAEIAHRDDHRDKVFDRVVSKYLGALKECLDITGELSSVDRPDYVRVSLEGFPGLIRHLTTALMQRREQQFPRPFAPPHDHNVFAPSEATLDYPVTIRGAEALNEDYHLRLKRFYAAVDPDCAPPLVNISGGSSARLEEPGPVKWRDDDHIKSIRRFLSLSCISLPRWSSQHIRTFAAAAHEHVHRLLHVASLADREANHEFDRLCVRLGDRLATDNHTRKDLKLDIIERFGAIFGDELMAVVGIRQTLVEQLATFFRELRVPRLYVQTDGIAAPEVIETYRTLLAERHANEFLADVGAVVISGPAFPFTYRTIYYAPTARQAHVFEAIDVSARALHQHPPWLVRVALMVEVLRHLGFKTTALRLERGIASDLRSAETITVVREYVKRIPQFFALLRHFADTVVDVAEDAFPNGSYDLNVRGTDEATMWAGWEDLADRVEHRGQYLSQDLRGVRPADLINAIWVKRIRAHHQEPAHRLEWRMALRNCFR